ncbi:unnamed protein product [Rotaria magnacalcarata]|uniref:Uncharacterized protein n=1 Tax=Rotaria magnacalcarata TaxID=392030 RepID=A0A816V8F3_9BILA|nr:unnamed protein product [Rotaria magnacalcarata]CAF3954719.1 unnamed protein product [Rotaria magnacalcarata]CAF4004279.1 unnamed protein product [Rotaria magnacalcarata]
MPSRATTYRRKSILLRRNPFRRTICSSNTLDKKNVGLSQNANQVWLINDEPLMKNDKPTTVFAPDTNSVDFNIVDGNSVNRRSCPTSSDIAASMMIFKVRRLQNNKDIDLICKLLNTFNIKNVPISMKSVETKLHRKFSLKEYFKCYYICSECGSSNTNYAKKCPNCDVSNLVEFYLYPVKQQIQQLLLVKGFYEKLKK